MPDAVDLPAGPADTDYPRRALSRLAVSATAQEAADRAAALVPTVTDDAGENVGLAAQLVAQAQDVLTRTVVHAREHGESWERIGEELGGITRQSAQERYRDELAEWDDALDRPWERSGSLRVSRLPDGLADPASTTGYLDAWCSQHAAESTRRIAEIDGLTERMVSARLPEHTDTTRVTLVLRHMQHLREREVRGEDVTDEWADLQRHRQQVYDTVAEHHRHGLEGWNDRDTTEEDPS